jgi:hypothetical protein
VSNAKPMTAMTQMSHWTDVRRGAVSDVLVILDDLTDLDRNSVNYKMMSWRRGFPISRQVITRGENFTTLPRLFASIFESRMTKEPPNKRRGFTIRRIDENHAIFCVAQPEAEKIANPRRDNYQFRFVPYPLLIRGKSSPEAPGGQNIDGSGLKTPREYPTGRPERKD